MLANRADLPEVNSACVSEQLNDWIDMAHINRYPVIGQFQSRIAGHVLAEHFLKQR
jgi:Mg2+/Co2+ transporter CorC